MLHAIAGPAPELPTALSLNILGPTVVLYTNFVVYMIFFMLFKNKKCITQYSGMEASIGYFSLKMINRDKNRLVTLNEPCQNSYFTTNLLKRTPVHFPV